MEKLDPHMQRAFCLGRLTKKSRVTFPPSHMSHSVANPALRSVWPRLTWRVFLYGCVIVFMFVLSHRVGLMRRCYEGQTLLTFEEHRAEADWLTEGGLWDDWTRLMTTEMSFKVRESRSDVNNRPEAQKRIQLCLMNSFIGSTQNNIRILCSGWCYKQFPVSCCEVRVISANTLCALLAKTNKNIW